MRQSLNKKNTRRIAQKTGLPVEQVLVRGGTDHRKDLLLNNGVVVHYLKDGSLVISDITCGSPSTNDYEEVKKQIEAL